MDWKQFIATMTGSLAWPVVVIVLLIVMRKHVGALADRLDEFSVGGAKLKFVQKLLEGRAIIKEDEKAPATPTAAEQTPPPLASAESTDKRHKFRDSARNVSTPQVTYSDPIEELARLIGQGDPTSRYYSRDRIVRVFDNIERVLREIGELLPRKDKRPEATFEQLEYRFPHTSTLSDLYFTLKQARNAAAHPRTGIGALESEEFERQAAYLGGQLEAIKARIKTERK